MKTHLKYLVVLLLAGLSLSMFAQFNVVVFAPKGEKFTLYLSGIQQNNEPAYRVEANNPGGPSFKIKVFFADPSLREINKTVFNSPGNTMYYQVTKNPKGAYVLESTGSEWMDDAVVKENAPPPAGNKSKSGQEQPKNAPEKTSAGKGCNNPISDPDFTGQLVGISAGPFDPIKLNNAKKVADKYCLRVSQIMSVMYVFDSESSRLSFAKYAYDHTYNPGDYAEVKDALHSERSKDDLDRYIAGKK